MMETRIDVVDGVTGLTPDMLRDYTKMDLDFNEYLNQWIKNELNYMLKLYEHEYWYGVAIGPTVAMAEFYTTGEVGKWTS